MMDQQTNAPLTRIQDQLKKCVKCGACEGKCPVKAIIRG